MNKEILEEKAMLYALGTLPNEEREGFEALLRSDRELQALVYDNQLLNELEVSECPKEDPPFHLYSRIMATIDDAKGEGSKAGSMASSGGKMLSIATWSGWAAAACVALFFAIGTFGPDENGALSVSRSDGALAAGAGSDIVLNNLANPHLVPMQVPSEEVSKEDRLLELSALTEAYWFSREGIPSDQLLEDEETDLNEVTGGFTVFDRKYQIGFIAVENLPHETEGTSYHVWARTDENAPAVRAGALPIGEDSRGLFYFDLSEVPEVSSRKSVNFFVTEESAQNPQAPTGSIVLSSYVSR